MPSASAPDRLLKQTFSIGEQKPTIPRIGEQAHNKITKLISSSIISLFPNIGHSQYQSSITNISHLYHPPFLSVCVFWAKGVSSVDQENRLHVGLSKIIICSCHVAYLFVKDAILLCFSIYMHPPFSVCWGVQTAERYKLNRVKLLYNQEIQSFKGDSKFRRLNQVKFVICQAVQQRCQTDKPIQRRRWIRLAESYPRL